MALDDRDHRILTLLRADAWLSYKALSRKVNLSASAVQRRVERMIASGIILGARAEVSVQDAQAPLTIFLVAEFAEESRAALKRFSAEAVVAIAPFFTVVHNKKTVGRALRLD